MLLKQYFIDFVNLIFPKVCYCCNEQLLNNEELICTKCYIDLPRIIVNDNENPVEKVFWGRVKTEKVFSFVQYAKGGKFQDLIHQLKYKGKKEIGFGFGKRFAKEGNSLSNKHVLLVDDVLTTGATLEACAMALQHEVNMRISIFTLGYA